MASKVHPKKVWKQTTRFITHEHLDEVIREIESHTTWSEESIRRRLFENKDLIRIPGARYHIYRDSLG